jgi:cellulose synthase operon protein C
VTQRFRLFGFGALVLIALAGVFVFGRATERSAQDSFAEAQSLLQQRDCRAARIELMNAVKVDPKMTEALIAQAVVSLELFDPVTAQSALEKAIANGTSKAAIAHLLGHSYWLQGELDKAQKTLSGADIEDANRAYANRILGRVEMDKGDLPAAQAAFDAALQLAPKDSQIWTDVARLRFVSADQKGAIDAVDYALKLDANNVRALEFRGRLMRSQFGVVAALPWFERALQISPSDIPLLEEYALTLGEAGRNHDMLAQARKIVALDGNNAKAFYMQAVLAARAGNYQLAKRVLPRAGEAFGELPAALLLDGIIEYELGNYNRAVDRLQRLLTAQPRNRRVRALLAQAMYRAGDPLDALDTIREIAARGDADSYSLMTTARAFEASDQPGLAINPLNDGAIAVIRPSVPLPDHVTLAQAADEVQRSPNDARAVVPYIRLLMLNGDIDTAANEATHLQAGNPGVADAHLLVGDIEMAKGNAAAAVGAYQKAREISFTEPVMLRLVDALARAGDGKAAGDTLAAYLAYNPTNLTALRLAGYRSLDARQWQSAIVLLERVRARLGYNDSILLANLARSYSGAGNHAAATRNAALAYRVAPANSMVTRIYGQVLLKSGKRPKAAAELLQKAANMMPDDVDLARDLRRAKLALAKSAKRE